MLRLPGLGISRPFSSSVVREILVRRGVSETNAKGIALALEKTVPSPQEQENYATSFPVDALQQLEASWKKSNKETGAQDCKLVVDDPFGREFTIWGSEGESLLDLKSRGTEISEYLEFACGGNMMCSTCHVYVVEPKSLGKLGSEEEQDMVDIAWEPVDDQSRLGCQIYLQHGVDIKIRLPKQATNYYK